METVRPPVPTVSRGKCTGLGCEGEKDSGEGETLAISWPSVRGQLSPCWDATRNKILLSLVTTSTTSFLWAYLSVCTLSLSIVLWVCVNTLLFSVPVGELCYRALLHLSVRLGKLSSCAACAVSWREFSKCAQSSSCLSSFLFSSLITSPDNNSSAHDVMTSSSVLISFLPRVARTQLSEWRWREKGITPTSLTSLSRLYLNNKERKRNNNDNDRCEMHTHVIHWSTIRFTGHDTQFWLDVVWPDARRKRESNALWPLFPCWLFHYMSVFVNALHPSYSLQQFEIQMLFMLQNTIYRSQSVTRLDKHILSPVSQSIDTHLSSVFLCGCTKWFLFSPQRFSDHTAVILWNVKVFTTGPWMV